MCVCVRVCVCVCVCARARACEGICARWYPDTGLSTEGSAYYIAAKAVRLALRALDMQPLGLPPVDRAMEVLMRYFKVSSAC